MIPRKLTGISKKQLQRWLSVFFLTLAIPTGLLIYQAYTQLKWEAFHHHRVLAEEFSAHIDRRFTELIAKEQKRAFTDFTFLNVAGEPSANFLQRSPLSDFPVNNSIPGLIGYFQVDTQGEFTSPLLPRPQRLAANYGISTQELNQRQALEQRILTILSQNRLVTDNNTLVSDKPTSALTAVQPGERQREYGAARLSAEQERADTTIAENRRLKNAPQAAFDELEFKATQQSPATTQPLPQSLGRIADLKLDSAFESKTLSKKSSVKSQAGRLLSKKAGKRKERSALPQQAPAPLVERVQAEASLLNEKELDEKELDRKVSSEKESGKNEFYDNDAIEISEQTQNSSLNYRIDIFESEIDSFELSLLDSGHLVLYRKVWRNGQRYIQGALLEPQSLFKGIIESAFQTTALSTMSTLAVAYKDSIFSAFSASSRYQASATGQLIGTLLYHSRLSEPLSDVQLIFSIERLPAGPGGTLLNWVAAILLLVLCGGFYLMYRLGLGQIHLARQQQDFVSAVSHELKTPLTSIRMYGEMLLQGWADEEKKKTYYHYIHDESERLTRLINNVLQLARMTRNDLRVDSRPIHVAELLDGLQSKISSQVERAGFTLNIDCDKAISQYRINVDADFFTQIIINLVDNAIKFSANAENKSFDIHCHTRRDNRVQFSVRDYGPGVPKDQMRKIFQLFYRSENELTRETIGTGIGLALVYQLSATMSGEVDVINREPGAEFRVSFPYLKDRR